MAYRRSVVPIGSVIGRLTVVGAPVGKWYSGQRRLFYPCVCVCGQTKDVSADSLKTVVSCGCWHAIAIGQRARTHGSSGTRLYGVWEGMHQRCSNPRHESYQRYGGRGIQVCEAWRQFENFEAWAGATGYKEGLTIERKDEDGGYSPKNCCWLTLAENSARTWRNRPLTAFGVTKLLDHWTRDPRCTISAQTIARRLDALGMDTEPAITTPRMR